MRGVTIIIHILQIKKQGRFRKRGKNSKWGQISMTNTRKGQITFLMQTTVECIQTHVDRKRKDLRNTLLQKNLQVKGYLTLEDDESNFLVRF